MYDLKPAALKLASLPENPDLINFSRQIFPGFVELKVWVIYLDIVKYGLATV